MANIPPLTSPIQFMPAKGKFIVDTLTDPGGAPLSVLEADQGFILTGRVKLPAWLTGTGHVQLFGLQIGGPFNGLVSGTTITITGTVPPPPAATYPWTITVPAGAIPDPPSPSGIYEFRLSFTFTSPSGVHTDIGGFLDLGTFMVV
jgi:hypothetical protein